MYDRLEVNLEMVTYLETILHSSNWLISGIFYEYICTLVISKVVDGILEIKKW